MEKKASGKQQLLHRIVQLWRFSQLNVQDVSEVFVVQVSSWQEVPMVNISSTIGTFLVHLANLFWPFCLCWCIWQRLSWQILIFKSDTSIILLFYFSQKLNPYIKLTFMWGKKAEISINLLRVNSSGHLSRMTQEGSKLMWRLRVS